MGFIIASSVPESLSSETRAGEDEHQIAAQSLRIEFSGMLGQAPSSWPHHNSCILILTTGSGVAVTSHGTSLTTNVHGFGAYEAGWVTVRIPQRLSRAGGSARAAVRTAAAHAGGSDVAKPRAGSFTPVSRRPSGESRKTQRRKADVTVVEVE